MLLSALLLLHLIGFAAFVGGIVAQRRFTAMSCVAGIAPAVRDSYERVAAAAASKIELPGVFAQVLTGVAMLVYAPGFLKQHWLHGKLLAVLFILVLSHVEMISAKKVVRARAERGDAADGEIAARKKRILTVSAINGALVGVVLLLVTVLREVL